MLSPAPPHALTGLCSYVLRTGDGEYIYDPDSTSCGYTADTARVYLWEPGEVAARIEELERRLPWAGRLSARRARP